MTQITVISDGENNAPNMKHSLFSRPQICTETSLPFVVERSVTRLLHSQSEDMLPLLLSKIERTTSTSNTISPGGGIHGSGSSSGFVRFYSVSGLDSRLLKLSVRLRLIGQYHMPASQ